MNSSRTPQEPRAEEAPQDARAPEASAAAGATGPGIPRPHSLEFSFFSAQRSSSASLLSALSAVASRALDGDLWALAKLLVAVILPTAFLSISCTLYLTSPTPSPLSRPLGDLDSGAPSSASSSAYPLSSNSSPPLSSHSPSRFLIPPYVAGSPNGPLPWDQLDQSVRSDFLLGGRVAYRPMWISCGENSGTVVWTKEQIDEKVKLAKAGVADVGERLCPYGPSANKAFFDALAKFPVANKSVLVIGSRDPWAEAIGLGLGARGVTTIDFNPPEAAYRGLTVLSLSDFDSTTERFEVVISFSSLEHDGLGRYGDPIHPFGDLERMKKIKGLVAEGGVLLLGVPNGNDTVAFNAHRVYGRIRFPMLIEGWKLLATFGVALEEAYKYQFPAFDQPVHVLTLES